MNSRFLPKLNYANVIATMALFVALGGVAVAAGLPKNSVGTKQLKRGAVTTADLRKAAVRAGKLAPKSVVVGKLGPSAVLPGNIGNGAVTSAKIGNGAVIARSIKNNVVTTNKLNNDAVTTQKLAPGAVTNPILANGSVTPNKLSSEFGPVLGTLKTGQTLRGVFDLGSVAATAGDNTRSAVSYQFPLANAPAVTVLLPGQTTANCAGLGSGQTPAATNGNLCIYVTQEENLEEGAAGLVAENNTRLGFGLVAKAKEGGAGKSFHALGQWAVTSP
jgi:hypothetical protein